MPINVKGHPDVRRYNPSRDIAYAWPNLMQAALAAFDKDVDEPVTGTLIKQFNISNEALGELTWRYSQFFEACLKQGDKGFKTTEDALASVGFFELPPSHQAVILARLGQVMTGAFFYAIRDTFVDADEPPFDDHKIIQAGLKGKEAFTNRKRKWYDYILSWLKFFRKE